MKLLFVFALVFSAPAVATSLKPFTILTTPVVNLSDLFDDIAADRPIGPGPAPGGRIVVESGQLSAIARQFGIDWRPASTADRAVLDRPGRALTRDDFNEELRRMLKSAGAPPEVDLDLAPISAALVPDHVPLDIELSQLEYDGNTGRFNVLATVSVTGCPPLQVRLAGRIAEMVEVPVPRRRMLVGDSLEAKDFEWARMRASQTRGDIVREPGQGAGLQARRSLPPGQPVQMADIGRPTLIQKGSRVSLSFDSPGIQLSAQGIAVGAAGLAETVSVVNPGSKIVVRAVVTGPGRARVIPDSAPRAIAANQVLAP